MTPSKDIVTQLSWRLVPDLAVDRFKRNEDHFLELWSKSANAIGTLAEWMALKPGSWPLGIPNKPSPLISLLVGGMAGAGLGYGAGTLAEKVLPDDWKRKRLRRTTAILGGLLGATPALTLMGTNLALGRNINDPRSWLNPDPYKTEKRSAYFNTPITGVGGLKPVDVNYFNQIVWNDPNVASRLHPSTQAAATGLVTGAANLPGKSNNRFATFHDIGRMTAGMGVGYAKGALVGQALGLLTGMPESMQRPIKQLGLFAGILNEVIPAAFGA